MERATKSAPESASTGGATKPSIAEAKARQSIKIKELKVALTSAGLHTIDEQARALGLCRSTSWSVLKGNHKSSGLSPSTINYILHAPELPPSVRTKIVEYVEERSTGLYGHGPAQIRRFSDRIGSMSAVPVRHEGGVSLSLDDVMGYSCDNCAKHMSRMVPSE
jgi:hypothetical protein